MQHAQRGAPRTLDGAGLSVGIVQARFNHEITETLARHCVEELLRHSVRRDDIRLVTVPGALEIPVALQLLAERGEHDALVAIGCVIRGETYHFELVADQSGAGIQRVALDEGVPIANVVLTVETPAQAQARAQTHGQEGARVALEMAQLVAELQQEVDA